jgi:hypothetical protein
VRFHPVTLVTSFAAKVQLCELRSTSSCIYTMPRAGAFSVWAIALCLLSSSGGSCARKLLQGSKALDCKKVSHKDGPIRTRDSCGGERDNRSASILPSVGETREFSADSDREKRVGGVESRTTFEKTAIGGKRRLRMEFPLAKVQCVTSAFGWREETELPHSGVDLWAEVCIPFQSLRHYTVPPFQ